MNTALHKSHSKNMLIVHFPDSIKMDAKEAKMILACHYYESGIFTSGQAAEMVGISKREFIEQMGKYQASLFHLTPEELESDFRNAL